MEIRAVIFDCFGVLYINSGHNFYQENVANYDELRGELLSLGKQVDYGFITREEHDAQVAELAGLSYDFVHANIFGGHVRNTTLIEYAQSLRNTHKIGLLSNVSAGSMQAFFSAEDQAGVFDAVVLSSDVGMIKPSEEIFRLTAERLGCAPEECLMIDDREENCQGAAMAGMKAVHYVTNEQTVREISQLISQQKI